MKKTVVGLKWLVGLVCAFAALSLLSLTPGVLAATVDSSTTEVTFRIAPALEVVSWPSSSFVLADDGTPGIASVSNPLTITLKANTNWRLQIASDTTGGMLREYDPQLGSYVFGGIEIGPVEWAADVGGPWTPLGNVPAAVFLDEPATGEDGVTRSFYLRVTPDFDARPLPNGRVYRLVLTYTAGVGY